MVEGLSAKVYSTCWSFASRCYKMHQAWSQLLFCAVLTFLQLNHPVVVFEVSVLAEGVGEQHLNQ